MNTAGLNPYTSRKPVERAPLSDTQLIYGGTVRCVKAIAIAILLVFVALWAGVPANAQDKPAGKVKAFVSILPAAYFVERVGGPNVEVSVLVGPGQDPHTFDPTPKLMTKLANAQVLFKMGFPFEETLIKKVGSGFKKRGSG